MAGRGKQSRSSVPSTPRVISPSPTPSELDAGSQNAQDGYFGPTTRSAARRRLARPQPLAEELDEDESPEGRRARTRSRSPIDARKVAKLSTRKSTSKAAPNGVKTNGATTTATASTATATATATASSPEINGQLLSPSSAAAGHSGWSWRDFSRSPSPLGLIPIHRHWRTFVHKHEVPRKALHVSIGFFVIYLYLSGTQTRSVCPYLMGALIPIAAVDVARHHYAPFNRLYVKVLGMLMRESEFSGYNGVIFYLLGAWTALYCFPKDVGVMATLLLSWCDTAASTFGRLYGRYTPRIRKGKSLAGSTAAFLVGVGTAAFFWGWLVPTKGPMPGDENFMFTGSLRLPLVLAEAVGLKPEKTVISGGLALAVMSVWSGFVAAASEVVDLFGWDDNLTIPVLSGLGMFGFLKVFG
ncbi:hypothetical protein QBC42DRAFT_186011 [Cladorrhinum samala]|uniref:Phosphatidate cytidylyltransferase n=1 Tax=Cladorrhinum samala TaxID=585594 RepID=A0AAV9HH99_9PEZI|nr:hypothetical protein QBC42DRAFT_186011 [Cladorrhinum samala]